MNNRPNNRRAPPPINTINKRMLMSFSEEKEQILEKNGNVTTLLDLTNTTGILMIVKL